MVLSFSFDITHVGQHLAPWIQMFSQCIARHTDRQKQAPHIKSKIMHVLYNILKQKVLVVYDPLNGTAL